MNLLDPILDQISKLWDRLSHVPVVKRGTVVQASPLLVQLDGDLDTNLGPVSTPAQSVIPVSVGDRVECVEQHRRVRVIGSPRSRNLTDNPGNGRAYFSTNPTPGQYFATGSTYLGMSPVGDVLDGAAWINHAGAEVFRVSKSGHLDMPGVAWAFAAGEIVRTTTIANTGDRTITVTLPSGRFSQPPLVVPQNSGSARLTCSVVPGSVTASQFQVRQENRSGLDATGNTSFSWIAVQMTSGSAEG